MAVRDRSTRLRAALREDALARGGVVALASRRPLGEDEIEELAARIDAERAGRELIAQLQGLPERERVALELVDLASLTTTGGGERVGDLSRSATRAPVPGAPPNAKRKGKAMSTFEDQLVVAARFRSRRTDPPGREGYGNAGSVVRRKKRS